MVIARRLSVVVSGVGRELVEANQRLEARVAELERRLNRSSRNSSLPPSQDPPSAPPRPGGKRSGRERGGQHGHEGRHRRLLPPEQVDEVVEHWPERCRSCAHVFGDAERVDAARAVAASGRGAAADRGPGDRASAARRVLPACAARTRGRASRRGAAVGVRAEAAGGGRDARGPEPCLAPRHDRARPGAVRGRALDRVGRRDHASAPARRSPAPHTQLEQAAQVGAGRQHRRDRLEDRRRPPHALGRADHARGGGVPDRGRPPRLRGQDAARRALRRDRLLRPLAPATTTSTRPAASSAGRTCSATSPPTAKGMAEPEAVRRARPRARARPLRRLARLPARQRPGRTPSADRAAPRPSSARMLEHAARKSPRPSTTAQFANNLLKRWPALWTFTHTDGVEPTNNHAERGLRGAVIHRKLSHGTQSERRRTHHRTPPLRLGHLPPPETIALRLPHRGPHRPRPRRPDTQRSPDTQTG